MSVKSFVKSKYLPLVFTGAAIVMMLGALKTGLVMDDLIQRIPHLKPSQIPPGLDKTGAVPENTGTLSAVLFERFGFSRSRELWQKAKNYGVLPWWMPDDTKCSLWRPVTAFTHWLDYIAFPNSPVLMHAHNIAWFAGVVFLMAIIYRKIIGPTGIAALAALMFVLDKNTYFPVMFVANRGFIISLCLGLFCFYMHHKWRTTGSRPAALFSAILFSLSLLANEAGVSTFAFILAYALVLDKETSRPRRLATLLPAILVIIIWRIIYQSLGYGISGIGAGYIDPGREPLKFLYHLPAYLTAIIAGQLSSVPPDVMMGLNAQYFNIISMFYIGFIIAAIILFLPIVQKDRLARFFFAVMVFAAVPIVAAPMSKNFGFLAIGAFGLIACFAHDLVKLPLSRLYKYPAWAFCIILLIAHIPLAALSKLTIPKAVPFALRSMTNSKGFDNVSLSEDCDVVIINAPCSLSVCVMPFNLAYKSRPIPNSIRALAFAYTGLQIERTDEKTLTISSRQKNIFTSAQNSPLHFSNAFAIADRLFSSSRMFEKRREFTIEGMTAEVLALDDSNLPSKIAFTFDAPLENKNFRWLQFNWKTFSYEPFELPDIGQSVETPGPSPVSFRKALRATLSGGKTKK